MADSTPADRERYVQEMFSRIAHRYDLMNRVMTAGQDMKWRTEVIRRSSLPAGGRLLDLGAGTGDLAREALKQYPDCHAVAADFALEMMRVGRRKSEAKQLDWVSADALELPFPGGTFDAVVSGFLLRNVVDIDAALLEHARLLRPGGKIIALDTTPPPKNLFSPFIKFHLHVIIPTLGELLAGEGAAYTYLPESSEGFLRAEKLAARMAAAGFQEVGFRRMMFGTVAIHWGNKTKND